MVVHKHEEGQPNTLHATRSAHLMNFELTPLCELLSLLILSPNVVLEFERMFEANIFSYQIIFLTHSQMVKKII